MYTTNNAEACHHCLESSEANICVVEDDKQLQKILSVRSRLPQLRSIIQYSGTPTAPGVMSVSPPLFSETFFFNLNAIVYTMSLKSNQKLLPKKSCVQYFNNIEKTGTNIPRIDCPSMLGEEFSLTNNAFLNLSI